MEALLAWLKQLHSSEGLQQLFREVGIYLPILIIFVETGLLVGFFLPGDSLLITVGVLSNPLNPNHLEFFNIYELCLYLSLAAVIGDQVGYYLGARTGDRVWDKKDSRFFKKKHLKESHDFFVKHGGLALVGARFVPIFRTFVPFSAGLSRMPYKRFIAFNIFGGVLWILSLLWIGYFLGRTKWASSLDKVIVIVVFVSILPILIGFLKRFLNQRKSRIS